MLYQKDWFKEISTFNMLLFSSFVIKVVVSTMHSMRAVGALANEGSY